MQNLITFNDIPQLMVDVLAKLKELDEKMDRLAPSVKAGRVLRRFLSTREERVFSSTKPRLTSG